MRLSNRAKSGNAAANAAISVMVAGLISSGHHVVVSLWIPAFVLLVLSALYLLWKYEGRTAGNIGRWLVLFGGVIFQTGFTIFECVYSHLLKNVLFFGGASQEFLEQLFPVPTYHLPDNLLFELTGVAQLAGFWAAWCAWCAFAQHSPHE
jgi:hypothetical protein